MSIDLFSWIASVFGALEILIPSSGIGKALVASVLLGVGCGLLGSFVVLRRIALMGDAVSHAVLPGVVVGLIYSPDRHPGVVFLCAALAGLIGVGIVRVILATTRLKSDAALGIVLATFFALGIVWQSRYQQETVGVMGFLFGNIGAIDASDLRMMMLTTFLLVVTVCVLKRPLLLVSFDEGFSSALGYPVKVLNGVFYFLLTISVVVALQAVGVVLVSAMLITPAAAAYLLTERFEKMLILSVVFGVLSGLAGAWVSISVNGMPTGPVISLAATVVFGAVYLFSPRHGVLSKMIRTKNRARKVRMENLLKAIYHLLEQDDFSQPAVRPDRIASHMKLSPLLINRRCQSLMKNGFLERTHDEDDVVLSDAGWRRSSELVRNHRLWELYLTHEADYADDHVHDDAEKIEHLLGADTIRKLEEKLNFPQFDPHGMPIPNLALSTHKTV